MIRLLIGGFVSVSVLLFVAIASVAPSSDAAGPVTFSIDMDPFHSPANTASEKGVQCSNNLDDDGDGRVNDGCPALQAPETGAACLNATDDDGDGLVNDGCPGIATLGSRQACAQVIEDNLLDADEVGVDSITLDITATNIPPPGIIGFAYVLPYPEASLKVTAQEHNFLLGALWGSSPVYLGDSLPDGDGSYDGTVVDVDAQSSTAETGDGTLQRLTLTTRPGAVPGIYPLSFDANQTGWVDPTDNGFAPDLLQGALLQIGPRDPGATVDANGCTLSSRPAVGGMMGLINPAVPSPAEPVSHSNSIPDSVAPVAAAASVVALAATAYWLRRVINF